MLISEFELRKLVKESIILEKDSPFSINTKIGNMETLASKDKKNKGMLFLKKLGNTEGLFLLPKGTVNKSEKFKTIKKSRYDQYKRWYGLTFPHPIIKKEERFNQLLDLNRVIEGPANQVVVEDVESTADIIIQSARDTFIELTAATLGTLAGIAAASGAAPLAAALEAGGNIANVADIINKISQNNFLGAAFGFIGLVPGGDTVSILKKLDAIDDVVPPTLAKEIAQVFVDLFDGDFKDTVTEVANSYAEGRDVEANQIVPKLQTGFQQWAKFFERIAEDPKAKTA